MTASIPKQVVLKNRDCYDLVIKSLSSQLNKLVSNKAHHKVAVKRGIFETAWLLFQARRYYSDPLGDTINKLHRSRERRHLQWAYNFICDSYSDNSWSRCPWGFEYYCRENLVSAEEARTVYWLRHSQSKWLDIGESSGQLKVIR